MPCGYRTGPFGWGHGVTPGWGPGFDSGRGPGMGAGLGGHYRGWSCNEGFWGAPQGAFTHGCCAPYAFSAEDEKAFLMKRAEWLRKQQEWIERRLREMGEKEKSSSQ